MAKFIARLVIFIVLSVIILAVINTEYELSGWIIILVLWTIATGIMIAKYAVRRDDD